MSFSTDTRTLQEGDVYIAIHGDRYDGHDFVHEAFRKGASRAVVERTIQGVHENQLEIVPDAIKYIAGVARSKVKRARVPVIAITGSVGKTTTRNAVTRVMQTVGPVISSVENLNTLLGLSLTLANSEIQSNARLVLEMGASRKGDLSEICQYFKPNISIVTNVRGVHLEMLGSLQGVREEKCELIRVLGSDGFACLNADDEHTRGMVAECKGNYLLYGTSSDADITPQDITVETMLLGDHVIYILLAAYAAGRAVGIEPDVINGALSKLEPEKGRLNQLPGKEGAILIDDSYNASPDAVMEALNVLSKQDARRRIVFLGDMLELGVGEREAHQQVLQEAVRTGDMIYGCGPRMQEAAMDISIGLSKSIKCFSDSRNLASRLAQGNVYRPQEGDVILVKGSQGARMERISRVLLAEGISPESVLPRQSASWLSI